MTHSGRPPFKQVAGVCIVRASGAKAIDLDVKAVKVFQFSQTNGALFYRSARAPIVVLDQ